MKAKTASHRPRRRILWLALLAAALAPGRAMPACVEFLVDGPDAPRHPGLRQEYAASPLVIEGVAVGREKAASPLDPEGVAAIFYTVRVTRIFKGRPGKTIVLKTENTSSRFLMDPGVPYLLFIQREHVDLRASQVDEYWVGNGDFWFVDACGNSGPAALRKDAIWQVQSLPRPKPR